MKVVFADLFTGRGHIDTSKSPREVVLLPIKSNERQPNMNASPPDSVFMRLALDQAHNAALLGEVPVGAVLVRSGVVLATGYNHPIGSHDPTAHAEIRAIRAAAEISGNYRLPECELFVTLEPCAMCAGAILHARLKRVVFGASDPKTGACGSVINVFDNQQLNHQTKTVGGVLAEESADLLREFFKSRRSSQSG